MAARAASAAMWMMWRMGVGILGFVNGDRLGVDAGIG
jgi:hypothetical protein